MRPDVQCGQETMSLSVLLFSQLALKKVSGPHLFADVHEPDVKAFLQLAQQDQKGVFLVCAGLSHDD